MNPKMNRRHALAALGTVSLASLLAACSDDDEAVKSPPETTTSTGTEPLDEAGSCRLSPELAEGPYYFDADAIRSDIREDREGMPLKLRIRVREAGSCKPLENAVVDVWHCDANGLYSGFEAASRGGPPGGSGRTDEETYLRGAQATNADGIAQFTTVYPGWYRGRTTHVHVKVHLDRTTVLTTQLFFEEEVNEAVYETKPYSEAAGRDVSNEDDGLFDESLVVTSRRDGDGYLSAINFDVERT